MSKLGTNPAVRPALETDGATATPEKLLCAFNEMRDDLVSTLWFVLGNPEDAQDIAQEAFLRCWRAQKSLPEIRDLRAWIFRVGLNAAKDLQRSSWRRRTYSAQPPSYGLSRWSSMASVRSATASRSALS